MWRNLFQNRRAAIKEGGDNLPMGLCFAAQSGNVLFLNRMMESLSYRLIGESLQNATYFGTELQTEICKMELCVKNGQSLQKKINT